MRRVVLEVEVSEFVRFSGDKTIEKIKSLEVLNFIRQDKEELIVIANVEFKDAKTKLDDVFNESGSEITVLGMSNDRKYTVLFRSRPQNDPSAHAFWAAGGYLLPPLEIKNGKVKMTFLGNSRQVKMIPMMLKRSGVRYKVVHLSDASFSSSSPLSRLTEKQRRVLMTAYNSGYYDLPRKIDSRGLAAKLNIGSSDLIKHRRKAERNLLAAILRSS